MARSIYKSLLEDLRHNDVKSFRATLDTQGLPQDDNWYDYDLLLKALRLNRKRMVNYLLNKRCRVNKPLRLCNNTNTPLHFAAEKLGWCAVVRKMLKLKARVTDVNVDGNTPLHLAFINGHSDHVVNLLLECYMNESTVDIRNKDGLGFMHIACTRSNYESLKAFFDVGFSDIFSHVSPTCNSVYAGFSPLHFAVIAGRHDVANFLCEYEADVYAQDRNQSTPLHLALEKGDTKMIDILSYYDHRNENYTNNFGMTHFMAACAGSDLNVIEQYISIANENPATSVRFLLNGRVSDIADYAYGGYTPLHFACEYGRIETVYGLLCIGAGHHCLTLTTNNLTPHNIAMKQQHFPICQLIEQFYYEYQQTVFAQSNLQQQEQQLMEKYYVNCNPQAAHPGQYYESFQVACA